MACRKRPWVVGVARYGAVCSHARRCEQARVQCQDRTVVRWSGWFKLASVIWIMRTWTTPARPRPKYCQSFLYARCAAWRPCPFAMRLGAQTIRKFRPRVAR